jgi:SAM-dependent methyltransferase
VTESHVTHNRKFWDADSDAYQDAHGEALARAPLAWGAYRVPEAELHVLGDVRGCAVLELGCGGGQWSIALAPQGAAVTGLDLSRTQLTHARAASASVPLTLASGEQLPFRAGAFDVVFCDHGAISFCDPATIVPECARVLRPGGRLAFCVTHPLLYLTYDEEKQRQTRKLHLTYDDLGQMAGGEGTIDWVLTTSEWFSVLRAGGFVVDDVLELRPPAGTTTTYEYFAPPRWARRWPAEWIWKATRR